MGWIDSLSHLWTCLKIQGCFIITLLVKNFTWRQIRSVKESLGCCFWCYSAVYPSPERPAGGSRGPCMSERRLSHSEFTICCSARVPRRCQTQGGRPNACCCGSSHFYYYYYYFFSISLCSVFPGHFFKWRYELQSPEAGLRFTRLPNHPGREKEWNKIKNPLEKSPSSRIIDFNDSLALFWNEKPKSTAHELQSS